MSSSARLTTIPPGGTTVVMTRPLIVYDRSMKFIVDLASATSNQSFECLIRYIGTDVDHVEYGILGEHPAELAVILNNGNIELVINNSHSEDVKVLVTPLTDIAVKLY